jgi:acyl-coenzyme A synthetase/AMP-(fatty) acid ligase
VSVAAAFDEAIAADSLTGPPLALDAAAVILCTSGSTGLPRAIVHSQRTMLHWVRTVADALHLTPDDRVLSISSPSTLGGFVALLACSLTGASMQMLDVKPVGFGVLLDVLKTQPVTILRAAPSFLRALARVPGASAATARLRLVQLFGEPLWKADLVELRKILPADCLIRSTYGSTEASGLSWFAGGADDYDPFRSPTGILMPDTTALIVDDDGRPCRSGEAGELVIRSRYNALGEWKRGEVSGEMFEPGPSDDPFRTYRTGDVARFHPDGVFVILGRKDRMLKLNGQRVEPGEVEAALRRSPEIAEVEVLPHERAGTIRLVAFAVPRPDAAPNLATRLDADLRTVLPKFMIPSRILLLSAMPRLPGGKADARQLLSLADERTSHLASNQGAAD